MLKSAQFYPYSISPQFCISDPAYFDSIVPFQLGTFDNAVGATLSRCQEELLSSRAFPFWQVNNPDFKNLRRHLNLPQPTRAIKNRRNGVAEGAKERSARVHGQSEDDGCHLQLYPPQQRQSSTQGSPTRHSTDHRLWQGTRQEVWPPRASQSPLRWHALYYLRRGVSSSRRPVPSRTEGRRYLFSCYPAQLRWLGRQLL
jgi:hypothetical protein